MTKTDVLNTLAAAVGRPAIATMACNYCGQSLTAEEHANHLEAGETTEWMCDKCAESTEVDGPLMQVNVMPPAVDPEAERIRLLELEIQVAKARLENTQLAAKSPAKPAKSPAAAGLGKKPESQPAISGTSANTAAESGKKPAATVPDALLVEVVKALRMPVAKDGKWCGIATTPTVAKLVYATLYTYLGSDPVGKAMVSQIIDSAVERRILSRRFSAKCMLLWDYTEMPNPDRPTAKSLPTDLASRLAAAFGRSVVK